VIDVVVAGGGPAGLATAIRGALAGLSVVVVEPRPAPIDKACGEGLMPSAVARLAAIGVCPAGCPLRGIRYLDGTHRVDAAFRGGTGRGVRRTVLHEALAARAAQLGVRVIQARVDRFSQDGGGVSVATRRGEITARYLVAADGLHSPIRRACGLDPPPARHPRYGLRRHYRVAPWTDMVEVHWAADAEAYITPVSDDLVGVAVLCTAGDTGARGGLDSRLAAFPEVLERLEGARGAAMGDVRGAGPLRQDVRRRVAGRVLLAGDAAGYGTGSRRGVADFGA